MKAIDICGPFLYSIQYDGEEENEFDRLLKKWRDLEYVTQFIEDNKDYLTNPTLFAVWAPDARAVSVVGDFNMWDERLHHMELHGESGIFELFIPGAWEGAKYKYEIVNPPMKSYGTERPSLLRFYAIKLDSNVYLITGGGIKLGDKIQNSPDLKDHVIQNIEKVKHWMKQNGILDSNDL